jgi:hypothetical protein
VVFCIECVSSQGSGHVRRDQSVPTGMRGRGAALS